MRDEGTVQLVRLMSRVLHGRRPRTAEHCPRRSSIFGLPCLLFRPKPVAPRIFQRAQNTTVSRLLHEVATVDRAPGPPLMYINPFLDKVHTAVAEHDVHAARVLAA